MNRRGFLGTLGAFLALPAVDDDSQVLAELRQRDYLFGEAMKQFYRSDRVEMLVFRDSPLLSMIPV